jgi:hypothetical protein
VSHSLSHFKALCYSEWELELGSGVEREGGIKGGVRVEEG